MQKDRIGFKKRLYTIFYGMKTRCYNPNHNRYAGYGGRGINICNEWLDSFETFYQWSIKSGYEEYLTIDRINVDGNYEPLNCRWVTTKEQNRNTKRNIIVEYEGERKTLVEWSDICNIPYYVLRQRYKKGDRGETMFRKYRNKNKKVICIEKNKVFNSISEAEKSLSLKHGAIWQMLKGNNKSAGGFTWRLIND